MPIAQHQAENQHHWAVWHVSESEQELLQLVNESPPAEIGSPQKKMEWLASRALTKQLAEKNGLAYQGMTKDEFGKPFLVGYTHPISLSHSYPYVAAQLSRQMAVGIDLEQPKQKLLKVAHRVLSPSERLDAGDDIIKHCLYWSAKESLYKIYGKRGLHFIDHLIIQPFERQQQGKLYGVIRSNFSEHEVTLGYQVHLAFVLVYTLNA